MRDEIRQAIREELSLYRFAEREYPETPIGQVKACGCMGPSPECKCAKRKRLVDEFMEMK